MTFQSVHADQILGTLTQFDRLIFKGHFTLLYPDGAFQRFLSRQGVLLKDFGQFVKQATDEVRARAEAVAAEARRPYEFLRGPSTKASGFSKEDRAKALAKRDGITQGLIGVFAALEPCTSFAVKGNRQRGRLEVVRARRMCVHYYFYYQDSEFGLMHVRLQSWFPFEVQVYVNGREWLVRRLDALRIGYRRYENALLSVDDLPRAQRLCDEFAHRRWPRVLNALASHVNPWLPRLKALGFGGYFWCIDQAEMATDVLFRSRAALAAILPDLFEYAATTFSSEDVMRFLGRKLTPAFAGEVTTDHRRRPEGRRVKHHLKRNSLKMYDKATALRIETTINNPREFKVLRRVRTGRTLSWRWKPMGKGVANFWRYAEVARAANGRYLDALAHVPLKGKVVEALDDLCRSATREGRHVARLEPLSASTCALFRAVLAGEHALSGLRNRDLTHRLYPNRPASPDEARRRCARVSRLIAKLRAHGLLRKVKDSRLYRATERGLRLMTAAIHLRTHDFPAAFQATG